MLAAALFIAGIACFALHTWAEINCTRLDVETGRRDPGALVDDYGSNRGWYWRYKLPSLAGFIGGILLWLWAIMAATIPAQAHDHNRPNLNEWYRGLASARGPCCDGSDVAHVEDPHWKIVGDYATGKQHYEVFLESEWRVVPDEAVLPGPNLDGRALVWPIKGWGGLTIRCFMPGTMG